MKKSEWNEQFGTLLPLRGMKDIASKELSPEVTIRKLSKFNQIVIRIVTFGGSSLQSFLNSTNQKRL
jgi:hypothetical protein